MPTSIITHHKVQYQKTILPLRRSTNTVNELNKACLECINNEIVEGYFEVHKEVTEYTDNELISEISKVCSLWADPLFFIITFA